MKVVGISGSNVGSKTRTAMNRFVGIINEKQPHYDIALLDLKEYELPFSDGRNYMEYTGDVQYVTQTIMEADIVIIGTPIFQASIPAALKNIFDLLPKEAFADKVVSMLVTAGSSKHYLIPEQQLKPILSYMKARLVSDYVFIEEKDFYRQEIVNDQVIFRMEHLVEETLILAETQAMIREVKK